MRAVGLVLLVALAAVAGAVAGFVHRATLDVLGVAVPVGMVAALGALTGLALLARLLGRSRTAVALVGAAFAVPVLVLSQFRPEGDLVIAEDVWGLTLIGGTALVVTVGVVVPFVAPAQRSTAAASVDDHLVREPADEPAPTLSTPERP
ncbi:MAG: hypothetical protein WCA29_07060 [Jiangellales bacterium]